MYIGSKNTLNLLGALFFLFYGTDKNMERNKIKYMANIIGLFQAFFASH